MSLSATYQIVMFPVKWDARQEVEAAENQHRTRRNVGELIESIKAEIVRLGLDVQGAHRTPAQYLSEAHAGMQHPVIADATSSVVSPLRSSINRAIDELIRRRPIQEETGSNRRKKLLSIGRHCSRAGLPLDNFNRLADDDEVLNADLSDGLKQKTPQPDELVNLFYKGVVFLRALLAAVDESRLKAP